MGKSRIKTEYVGVRMPPKLAAETKALAEGAEVSLTDYVTEALRRENRRQKRLQKGME